MQLRSGINFLLLIFYSAAILLLVLSLLNDNEKKPEKTNFIRPERTLNEFGFTDDSLTVKHASILPYETFSGILTKLNLTADEISELLLHSRNYINFRKIIPGNQYHSYFDKENNLRYFVYEKDPVNYVVINIDDSISTYNARKEVRTERKTLAAVINQSLYTAMLNNEANPELVISLSEVFAWQVDFYRIQKGDYFKVIYDEEFVGDRLIGIKNIIGAYFRHSGEEFYAVHFNQDSTGQFFDENGRSLRKAFLKAPIKYSRISSRFSYKRLHPVTKVYKAHFGTDYAAPAGTPIRTVGDGTIVETSYSGGNGRYVKIRHNSVYTTQYLHMAGFAKGIRPGAKVHQGDIIGYVGSTGLATGPHLCYRFWKNGVQVDPLKEKIPSSLPVKPELLEAYNATKDYVILQLQNLKLPVEQEPQISSVLD